MTDYTPTLDSALTETLAEYARELIGAGFTVYLDAAPRMRYDGTPIPAQYFTYSQVIDNESYFGYVQADYWGEYDHSMPIQPSRAYGSAMHVTGTESGPECLTVETARKVARPFNTSPYTGVRGQQFRNARPWSAKGEKFVPVTA